MKSLITVCLMMTVAACSRHEVIKNHAITNMPIELTKIDNDIISKINDIDLLKQDRIISAKYRDSSENGSETYWLCVVQILEISDIIGDTKLVHQRYKFDDLNGGPRGDLRVKTENAEIILSRYDKLRTKIGLTNR
jgi:hypothetical protein